MVQEVGSFVSRPGLNLKLEQLLIVNEDQSVCLQLVRGYKHLGTYIQEDCRPNKDVVCKRAGMGAPFEAFLPETGRVVENKN